MQTSKKIVLLGHFGVGKTSLIRRFVHDEFKDVYKVTIGVHISKKEIEIASGETISLIIWDLEGTDDLSNVLDAYFLGTHGFVYVFDVSRPSTFQNIREDLVIAKQKMPKIPNLVIGNKLDLVVEEDLLNLLKKAELQYDFLASAKTGSQVNEAFLQLVNLLYPDA